MMAQEGYLHVVAAEEAGLNDAQIRENIAKCDIFLLGTLPTSFTAVEWDIVPAALATVVQNNNNYPDWLKYAASLGKNVSTSRCAHHTISSTIPNTWMQLSPFILILGITTESGSALP